MSLSKKSACFLLPLFVYFVLYQISSTVKFKQKITVQYVNKTLFAKPLKRALDGMQQFMTGCPLFFDPDFYLEMVECFEFLDPRMLDSVGAQWNGMIRYAENLQAPNGDWTSCANDKWYECNCTVQEYGKLHICEPCNYASNLAYYHTATEICARKNWHIPEKHVKAMAKSFALLAQGSAFWHGTESLVGDSADVIINNLFGYVAFQSIFDGIEAAKGNPIIHELSMKPRSKSGIEYADFFINMYLESPVEKWGDILLSADIPELRLSMCGYFTTVVTLIFPPKWVDQIVEYASEQFSEMTDDIKTFCFQKFLTELRTVVIKNHTLPHNEWWTFQGNTISTVTKLVYAALWQEDGLFTESRFWFHPIVNKMGIWGLPWVNRLANSMSNFTFNNPSMQDGINIYPGEERCNSVIPHAKWHLETSIGLTNFAFLSDEINRVLTTYYNDK